MNLFGHVCARALPKNALVSSIDCLKINLKVRNMSSKVNLPQNDVTHIIFIKMLHAHARRRAAGGRTHNIQNHLDKLVEHK